MKRPTITTTFYLSLLEFMLSGKQQVITVGSEFGLTSIQALTLLLMNERQPRSMKSLGLLFHCDASNVTGIVDGLEQKGLVSRQNDPNDRRVKTVCVEPAGKHMQQQIIKRLAADGAAMFAPLDDEELSQFMHAMQKLVTAHAV